MATDFSGIKGIGPKKEKILVENGYGSIEKLSKADFYDIVKLPGFGVATAYGLWEKLGLEINYLAMTEFNKTQSDEVVIENKAIRPWRDYLARKKREPKAGPEDFKTERTTVWSFPSRGDWASHTPQYRGNWPPQMVRNIIELYSKVGDVVLDPMVGGGTTPVECLLTGRNSVSIDINPGALLITRDRLNLPDSIIHNVPKTSHKTYLGDIRKMDAVADSSIDLIATHPPYVNIISYAPHVDGDLSQLDSYSIFFKEFSKAIAEMSRVLKPGGYCAILIGDTHNRSHFVPVSTRIMIEFLKKGFVLKEDVIKMEWNCESNHNLGKYHGADFLLTMHEHLFIFRKPSEREYLKNSSIDFLRD